MDNIQKFLAMAKCDHPDMDTKNLLHLHLYVTLSFLQISIFLTN